MMTILHGDDTTASRNYYLEQITQHHIENTFDGDEITLTDLVQIFEGGGFFQDTASVGIENLLSKRKQSKELDSVLTFLNNQPEGTVILWESKSLPKTKLNQFKNADSQEFKLPQHLFQFLDSLKPGNPKQLIELFHKNLVTTEPEMLFFMMVRQFRMLLALSQDSLEQIEEAARLAPWQKSKLVSQSRQFSVKQLGSLHNKLYSIELGQKTGTLNLPLTSAIDIFLLEI